VRSEARNLNKNLNKLMLLTNLTKKAEREMRISLESIQTARAALIKAASDRTDLPVRFIEDPEKLKSISKSSKSLNEFAIALNSIQNTIIRSEEPISKDYAGSLSLPVEGIIVRKFNDVDAAGIIRPGIVIRTKNHEIVTSPISATIRYAGPLLDYGMVSILEPEDGVLLIFAGLGRVFGKAGQILSQSSPIGFMAGQNISAENFITETELSSGRLSQSLYIEVRYNDKPQDPSDWFEIDKE
jgi:septal ring factor EnvC (AmiA/AmiB activator)